MHYFAIFRRYLFGIGGTFESFGIGYFNQKLTTFGSAGGWVKGNLGLFEIFN